MTDSLARYTRTLSLFYSPNITSHTTFYLYLTSSSKFFMKKFTRVRSYYFIRSIWWDIGYVVTWDIKPFDVWLWIWIYFINKKALQFRRREEKERRGQGFCIFLLYCVLNVCFVCVIRFFGEVSGEIGAFLINWESLHWPFNRTVPRLLVWFGLVWFGLVWFV